MLQIATALKFLPAAAELRATLYQKLANNELAPESPDAPGAVAAAATAAATAYGPSPLGGAGGPPQTLMGAVFSCLCAAESGAKLVAMVLKGLGLRAPGTIHFPGGWLHLVICL